MVGVAWLSNTEPVSVDGLARQISALQASGEDVATLCNKLIDWRNIRYGWGAYPLFESSLPDTPLTIITLMDALGTTYTNEEIMNAVAQFIPSQMPAPDYLWSYRGPNTAITPLGQSKGAIIPTVYAIQALNKINTAPDRFTSLSIGGKTYTLSTVINNAISGLFLKRKNDNGFGDGTVSTVLETALVYQVLKSIRPTDPATTSALGYLLSQQSTSGDWCGDGFQTAVVLSSLPLPTAIIDTDMDGIPDGVENLIGKNPNIADSRSLASDSDTTITSVLSKSKLMSKSSFSAKRTGNKKSTSKPFNKKSSNRIFHGTVRKPVLKPVVPPFKRVPVDMELFITGTNAEMDVVETSIISLFKNDSVLDIFYDDGGSPGDLVGNNYRAYLGVIGNSKNKLLNGKKVLIHFSGDGGSYSGVGPLVFSTQIKKLVLDEACTDKDNDHIWSCPIENTKPAIPDAGISEVQPEYHTGENVPRDQIEPGVNDLKKLNKKIIFKGYYGIAATNSLMKSGIKTLSIEDIRKILSGDVTDWKNIDPKFMKKPVVICRMIDGAQPAANAIFLNIPCNSEASSAYETYLSSGYLVVENSTLQDLTECLNVVNDGGFLTLKNSGAVVKLPAGGFAVGILPLSLQPGPNDHYGFIPIVDRNGIKIPETYFSTQFSMQWLEKDTDKTSALSRARLNLLQEIRAKLSESENLYPYPGVAPVDQKGFEAPGPCKGGLP